MPFDAQQATERLVRRYELRALRSAQGEVKTIPGPAVQGLLLIPGALPFPEPFVSIEFKLRTRA